MKKRVKENSSVLRKKKDDNFISSKRMEILKCEGQLSVNPEVVEIMGGKSSTAHFCRGRRVMTSYLQRGWKSSNGREKSVST